MKILLSLLGLALLFVLVPGQFRDTFDSTGRHFGTQQFGTTRLGTRRAMTVGRRATTTSNQRTRGRTHGGTHPVQLDGRTGGLGSDAPYHLLREISYHEIGEKWGGSGRGEEHRNGFYQPVGRPSRRFGFGGGPSFGFGGPPHFGGPPSFGRPRFFL